MTGALRSGARHAPALQRLGQEMIALRRQHDLRQRLARESAVAQEAETRPAGLRLPLDDEHRGPRIEGGAPVEERRQDLPLPRPTHRE